MYFPIFFPSLASCFPWLQSHCGYYTHTTFKNSAEIVQLHSSDSENMQVSPRFTRICIMKIPTLLQWCYRILKCYLTSKIYNHKTTYSVIDTISFKKLWWYFRNVLLHSKITCLSFYLYGSLTLFINQGVLFLPQ